jgi:hypothetical protein
MRGRRPERDRVGGRLEIKTLEELVEPAEDRPEVLRAAMTTSVAAVCGSQHPDQLLLARRLSHHVIPSPPLKMVSAAIDVIH